jgi:predicted DCC family thiol-disulfide oxidoreductase YuxK
MKRKFYFASLQSGIGQELLGSLSSKGRPKDSIILYKNGKIYSESTAILKVLSALPGIWKGAIVLLVIPGFIRDGVYRFVAKNRYAWFGRRDSCMVPGPGIQSRFID